MAPRIKVLLVNPPTPDQRKFTRNADCAAESKGNYLWQPYDFLLLSGAFSENVDIEFIDYGVHKFNEAQFVDKLKNTNLIITSIVEVLWDNDLEFLFKLRALAPQMPILCFGDVLIEDQPSFEVLKIVDGIIPNPMSVNFSVLKTYSRDEFLEKSNFIGLRNSTTFKNIEKKSVTGYFRNPKHELFLDKKYRWPFATYKQYSTVTTSWGCPYSCTYCTGFSLPSIYRPYPEIIAEMQKIKRLGVKEIYFSDKSFGIPQENTTLILKEMIKNDFKFSWSTYLHPNQFTENFLDLMKSAGCHTIIIGIETLNFAALRKMGRVINEKKLFELIDYANKIKINICGDFIIGLPEEKVADILSNINFAINLNIQYASFNIATPLPGTSIKKLAIEQGRMQQNDHNFDSTGYNKIINGDQLTQQELIHFRNYAVKKFYLRPNYIFKRLLSLRGLEHFFIQFEEMMSLLMKTILKL